MCVCVNSHFDIIIIQGDSGMPPCTVCLSDPGVPEVRSMGLGLSSATCVDLPDVTLAVVIFFLHLSLAWTKFGNNMAPLAF